ncbi:MAG: hypothetical protein NUV56_01595 [Candidatus Uhrbacteria bacterium]|nr:hypothetical protein [Candidatus Uhrbacteria bacterium]
MGFLTLVSFVIGACSMLFGGPMWLTITSFVVGFICLLVWLRRSGGDVSDLGDSFFDFSSDGFGGDGSGGGDCGDSGGGDGGGGSCD